MSGVVYLSNPEAIAEVYINLKAWLTEPICEASVDLPTRAGAFTIDRAVAEELHALLEGWDRADSRRGTADGRIDRDIIIDRLKKPVLTGTQRPTEFGVALRFRNFIPSCTWHENEPYLFEAAGEGRVFQFTNLASPSDPVWAATTLATLSNITPADFNQMRTLCRPENKCDLALVQHDPDLAFMKSGMELRGSEPGLKIYWNLSGETSETETHYRVRHEFGHYALKMAALRGGERSFADLMIALAASVPHFREVGRAYAAHFRAADRDLQFQFEATLQEAVDAAVMNHISPQDLAVVKNDFMKHWADTAQLPRDLFAEKYRRIIPNPAMMALYMAMQLHVAESVGVSTAITDRFGANSWALLASYDPQYREIYKTAYRMAQIASRALAESHFAGLLHRILPAELFAP